MKSLVDKIAEGLEGGALQTNLDHIQEKSQFTPQIMKTEEAGKLLKDKKNVIILTGAGLSASSGIPTFRGNDGLWTKYI